MIEYDVKAIDRVGIIIDPATRSRCFADSR